MSNLEVRDENTIKRLDEYLNEFSLEFFGKFENVIESTSSKNDLFGVLAFNLVLFTEINERFNLSHVILKMSLI